MEKEKKIITAKELAEALKCSRMWIYREVYRGNIPHFNIGNRLRFCLEDVLDALNVDEIKRQIEKRKNSQHLESREK